VPCAAPAARRILVYALHYIPPDEVTFPAPPLRAMRTFVRPNLVCFTRAAVPPVPGLVGEVHANDLRESGERLGNKRALKGASQRSLLNLARLLSALDWSANGNRRFLSKTCT